jgi:hypothetical protein
VDVTAAEDDLVIVDNPDVFINNVVEAGIAAARLIHVEAHSLQAEQRQSTKSMRYTSDCSTLR